MPIDVLAYKGARSLADTMPTENMCFTQGLFDHSWFGIKLRLQGAGDQEKNFDILRFNIVFSTIDNWYLKLIIEEPVIESRSNNDNTFYILKYHIKKTHTMPRIKHRDHSL